MFETSWVVDVDLDLKVGETSHLEQIALPGVAGVGCFTMLPIVATFAVASVIFSGSSARVGIVTTRITSLDHTKSQ